MRFDLPTKRNMCGEFIIWNKEFYGVKSKIDPSGFGHTNFIIQAELLFEKEFGTSYSKEIIRDSLEADISEYDDSKIYCAVGSFDHSENCIKITYYYYAPYMYKNLYAFEAYNGINSSDMLLHIEQINKKYGTVPVYMVNGNILLFATQIDNMYAKVPAKVLTGPSILIAIYLDVCINEETSRLEYKLYLCHTIKGE